jgi:hypothetical protein
MTTTLFTQINYTLATLLDQIRLGQIGLPEIQRPFVWPNTKVRDLFDSMYRGFPVGYLLFWSNGLPGGHKQIGADHKQVVPGMLIVDGQQRLTSLYAVVKGLELVRENYAKERIRIAFRPRDGRFQVADAAVQKDPEFVPDISVLWSPATGIFQFVPEFVAHLKAARPTWSQSDEKVVTQALSDLYNLVNYPFTALVLSASVDEEQVAEVFVRINSQGTTLNEADFILTLMSVFWDEGRAALERFCRDAKTPVAGGASPFNHFLQPAPDQLLRVDVGFAFRRSRLRYVYSLLRGKDLDTEVFSDERREQQFAILKQAQERVLDVQHWKDFLKVLLRAGYRNGDMITSKTAILYTYVLWLIGKYDYGVDHDALRDVMAQWFFAAALTGRYTASTETRMEQDLARLRDVKDASGFVALWRKVIADTLTEDYWQITLPNDLSISSARAPSLFAYYAALNLLDARVLFSKIKVADLLDPAMQAKKSSLERHHLFPRKYLTKIGVADQQQANQLANFALVEWKDNIEISDCAPAAYLPKYLARFRPQEGGEFQPEDLSRMYYWHALAPGWEKMGYSDFLQTRRKRMARVVRDAFTELFTGKTLAPDLEKVTIPDGDWPEPEPAPTATGDAQPSRYARRREFWEQLLERAKARTTLHENRSPTTDNWLSTGAGRAGLYYNYVILMGGAQVQLEMVCNTPTETRAIFDQFDAHRKEIEGTFAEPLLWDRGPEDRLRSYIRYPISGGGLQDKAHWPEIQDKMIDALIRLEDACRPTVQQLPGKTSAAQGNKAGIVGQARTWDWASFADDLDRRHGSDVAQVAQRILEWAQDRKLRVWWGQGSRDGSFFPMLDHEGAPHWSIAVWTYGRVEILFQMLKTKPPFMEESKRLEFLHRLNQIPGVAIPESAIGRRPSLPLSALGAEATRAQFLAVIDWVLEETKGSWAAGAQPQGSPDGK